jgi:hypothetical protein
VNVYEHPLLNVKRAYMHDSLAEAQAKIDHRSKFLGTFKLVKV